MTIKTAKFAAVFAAATALAACATPTPYQPLTPGRPYAGGYTDQKIEGDRWRVTFAGNSLTSRETVEAYLLYRAAELTLSQGYDWFSVDDRSTDRNARSYVQPDPYFTPWHGFGFWRPSWRFYGRGFGWRTWDPFWGDPFWADRYDVRTVEKFEASAEIMLHHGAKPADDPRAFDAHAVVENLGPKIQRPVPGK